MNTEIKITESEMNFATMSLEELIRQRDNRIKFMSYRLGMKAFIKHRDVYDACVAELNRRDLLDDDCDAETWYNERASAEYQAYKSV